MPTQSPSPPLTLCFLTPPTLTHSCPLTLTDLEAPSLPITDPKCPKWPVLDSGKGPSDSAVEKAPPTTLPGVPSVGTEPPHLVPTWIFLTGRF